MGGPTVEQMLVLIAYSLVMLVLVILMIKKWGN